MFLQRLFPRPAGIQLKPQLFFSLHCLDFGGLLLLTLFLPITRFLNLDQVGVVGQTLDGRIRAGNASENFSIIRRLALNLIK